MTARKLVAYVGDINELFKLKKEKLLKIPGVGPQLADAILTSEAFKKADEELVFIEKYKIKFTSIFDTDYPFRLKQCEDAPLVFFSKGAKLNEEAKFISIVGTRNASPYGKDFCNDFIVQLKERGHQVVVVSGLAYGIDIAAHKASLKNNIPTYGILAHGLDTIYPTQHRNIATKMLEQGGLITEFMHGIFPDKNNFVRRNRIIAGLSDAVIVVESDKKGGSLLTADMANSYNRDVFAVPGKITDKYSTGCNNLIKSNRAALIQSVDDLEYVMGWEPNSKAIQKELFVELSDEEKILIDLFNEKSELNIDTICRNSGFNMAKVSAMLLNLEFGGLIKCKPGKVFYKI
ncbi:MAG: DNA-protecting protein DprA [Salinivirgaceae bacterium]|nr:DNA-protecting protein DprA [Salinivirgaceae bacterium]